ncbi:hypothetical protein ABVK25_006099 [Lepraria finkii]|uniref:Uncharacterized protein n=1 Tax=Lepraria finkii TaxID=1340010 RepID=A0ABR4BAD0_9LECA
MGPALAPINTVIQGTKDFEYVNQRLMGSGVFYTRVRAVNSGTGSIVSLSIACASPQSSDIVDSGIPMESTTASSIWGYDVCGTLKPISTNSDPFFSLKGPRPKPLALISPDSKIQCNSPDCPIKGIPHNVGRYFQDGLHPLKDEADDVIRFFNCTVPPPDITRASMRMGYEQASQADKDEVRQYQKHHMWPPFNSEPSTPRLRDPDHTLPARYAHLIDMASSDITVNWVIESSASTQAPPVPERNPLRIQIRLPTREERLRSLRITDFEDSDDENYVSDGSNGDDTESKVINPRYPMAGSYAADNDDEVPTSPGARREVPEGPELRRVHLHLQAKILGQTGQLVHGPDSPPTDWEELVDAWRNTDN